MEVSGCISVILLFSLNCGYCRLHGALVGLSTTIHCEGLEFYAGSPPFWIINGTVYELFSIPRLFPFISVVTDSSSLIFPYVTSASNNTTFQCARFGENGIENGTAILLLVLGGNDNSNIIFNDNPELVLNYQNLYMRENRVTISWVLNDTCSKRFQVQGYTLDTGEPVLSPEHVFDVGKSTSVIVTYEHVSNISYKLVALSENATLCSSTRDFYYRFEGVSTESRSFKTNPPCFNIPKATSCHRGSLNFIWPARAEGRSCACPVHNSSAGRRVFESCVEGCRDAVLTPTLTEEGHVCIYNLSSSLNGSPFHYVCSTEECGGDNFSGRSSTTAVIHTKSEAPTENSSFSNAVTTKKCSYHNILIVLSSSVAILESAIIAAMIVCILKFTKHIKVLEAAHAPPSPTVQDPGSTPVYEEIQELTRATRAQGTTRRSLSENYEFTTCPAYTLTEQESNRDCAA